MISEKEKQRRLKISKALKGRKKLPEHIKKIADANRGKKRTLEQNEKNKQRAIKQFSCPDNRRRARDKALKQWSDPEKRALMTDGNRRRAEDPITRKKISETVKSIWHDQDGPYRTEEKMNKLSNSMLKLWKDPEYVSKIKKSRLLKPNKAERKLLGILNDLFPNEWKFVGDFSFMIDGKNPDFLNVNGQKKLIELFGDYWHQGDNPQDRIDIFKPFGFDTLVVWESELGDFKLLRKRLVIFNHAVK